MRGAEQHLSSDEIRQLADGPTQGGGGGLEDAMRHLDACVQCRLRMLLPEEQVAAGEQELAQRSRERTPACPPESEWLELAAGILPQAERRSHLEHAATCARCGPLLKAAIEDLRLELTAEEESKVASLESGTTEWQDKLVEKITGSGSPTPAEEKPARKVGGLFFWPRWAFAAAASILVTGAGWWAWIQFRAPSVDTLLAQAYTERRTLEVRIPGARYAPMRVERGSGGSDLDKPSALLQAETLISENLRKSPNDPVWLQAKARADLLSGNYESAINSLQQAMEFQPDFPSMLTDLGSAYFLRAEVQSRPTDYGNAIESLSKALAKLPDDPVALFNHALSCERMFLYSQAVTDWEHYLRVDPSGDWSNDARINLQRVKQKMAEKEKQAAAPLLSPAEFSAFVDGNHENAVSIVDQHVERYLETAIQTWLPEAYRDSSGSQSKPAEARRALGYLAEILKTRHDDTWLADLLQSQASSLQKEGLQDLIASDEALRSGHYELGIELATKSVGYFQGSRNRPGMLRASFALMLAQFFALKFTDCLKTADAANGLLLITHYRWLQIQILIQQGQCEYATPQLDGALRHTLQSVEFARFFHYPGLDLRGTAFAAAYRADTGSADQGVHDLIRGLATFWQVDVTSTRGENLYSVLFNVAGSRNWHHLEALALAEKVTDFPSKDPVDQTVSWQLLAGAQERAGDYESAQQILQRTDVQLANLPRDSGTILRKAEIKLEEAGIRLHLGDPQSALIILERLRQQFETANGLFQAEYFKTYGEAYLGLGLDSAAEPFFGRALSIVETGLRSFRQEADKFQWSRIQSQVYRGLLEIKLKSGTPADALALWEFYKGASLRTASKENSAALSSAARPSFTAAEASSYSLPSATTLISYVAWKNSATAFVLRDGNVQIHVLQFAGDSEPRVLRFLSLCSHPSNDLASFDFESRRLYDTLIAPLESDIQGAATLRFETDGILDRIPFDLLRGPDGRYLGDRFEVTYSPGLAYGSHATWESLAPAGSALIVVASDGLPEAIDEGKDIAGYFRAAEPLSGLKVTRADVLRKLRNAEVFHFIGHAAAVKDHVSLLLGADAFLDSRDLMKAHPRNLRLAVLSACDTANGEEGAFSDVNSIARTLVVAGVQQTVASRWNVDSFFTRQLMGAFYANLMAGKPPADSLRAARATVRNLLGHQHPYYWASFAVFGG